MLDRKYIVKSQTFGDPDHSDIDTYRGLAWSMRRQWYLRTKSKLLERGYERITPRLIATFVNMKRK